MDLRKLKKLIDLVEESGIAELEVTEERKRSRSSRAAARERRWSSFRRPRCR
jgi:acetyl-CoA carboxylase biotin carboxyl carrier protein